MKGKIKYTIADLLIGQAIYWIVALSTGKFWLGLCVGLIAMAWNYMGFDEGLSHD